MRATLRRFGMRLAILTGFVGSALLWPDKGQAIDKCHFECWDSGNFPGMLDCTAGPPINCLSCLLYCPKEI
jgi:hypothetical protein